MKKLLYLLLLLIALPLNAQNWSFAPKIGLNLSDMKGDYFDGKMKIGLNAGFTAEYKFSKIFAIEPGVFYSMQGIKDEYKYEELRKDYINIPVLAKVYIKNGFNVFAGPQLGVNISGKYIRFNYNGMIYVEKYAIQPLDLSLILGMGYQFKMGFLISANYNIGFTNITDNSAEPSRNGVFQFNVGWRF